jgi:hypothetical protein
MKTTFSVSMMSCAYHPEDPVLRFHDAGPRPGEDWIVTNSTVPPPPNAAFISGIETKQPEKMAATFPQ